MHESERENVAPGEETALERVQKAVQEMLADKPGLTSRFREKPDRISVTIDVIPEGGRRSRPFVAPVSKSTVEAEEIRARIVTTAREYADLQTHPDCAVQVFLRAVDQEE